MYKVTGYFRDNKVTRSFTDLYDAIDFRDIVDAHYPLNVTFEKVIDMREFIYDSWDGIMDAERNPLKHIPDTNVRHMVMQVLAWMWCITFAMLIGSWTVFAISAVAHVFLIAAIVITVATFETAKRKPQFFGGFGRGAGGEHE
jgi:uncharacterized membrane protein YjjP (DUF1212 family)